MDWRTTPLLKTKMIDSEPVCKGKVKSTKNIEGEKT